jgi:hypothetical protein
MTTYSTCVPNRDLAIYLLKHLAWPRFPLCPLSFICQKCITLNLFKVYYPASTSCTNGLTTGEMLGIS